MGLGVGKLLYGASIVLALALCAVSVPAFAQATYYYPDGHQPPTSAGAYDAIPINITAHVGETCGFKDAPPADTYDAGDIRNAFAHQTDFQLECNGPLRMAITSQNGGLYNGGGTANTGYSNLEIYSVKLNIVPTSGSAVTATCTTDQLVSTLSTSSCPFFGTASTSVGLLLNSPSYDVSGSYVQVSNGSGYSGPPVLNASNNYTDTLTVTLSAAL